MLLLGLMNDFEPVKLSIGEIFRKDSRLIIPRFQRSYEWRVANIEDFYTDFLRVSQDRMNFLGNIVIDASKTTDLEIIDGQQRLITITILYATIRDILIEDIKTTEAIRLAENIDQTFIKQNVFSSSDSQYKLTPAKDLQDFFEAYIQLGGVERRTRNKPKNSSSKGVDAAYKRFKSLLKEDKIEGVKDPVRALNDCIQSFNRVSLIVINIYNQDMAYAIFESFNAKRVDLSVSDLVKNYYFSRINGNDAVKSKDMDRWDVVVDSLSSANLKIDRFLHYYVQSYEGRFPKSQLYRRLRARIESGSQKFIKDLEINARIMLSLRDAEVASDEDYNFPYQTLNGINESLENINNFNVEQCFILLMSLIRNKSKITPTFIYKIITLIENFTFLYSKVTNGQANVLEDIYSSFAIDLEAADPKEQNIDASSGRRYALLQSELKKHIPSKDIFVANFIDLDYGKVQQKRLILYIFKHFEEANTRGGTKLGFNANIDHVFPQNPPSGSKKPSLFNKIGNLVPIDATTNSKIGNQLPLAKVDIYKGIANITQVSELVEFINTNGSEFDNETINKRGEELANKSYDLWNF